MKFKSILLRCFLVVAFAQTSLAAASPRLELSGYMDDSGAISVLHGGDSADPYFAMQALLLAHENGLNIEAPAEKFANWMAPKQKPDGTFDRFCKGADKQWVSCKPADADDSLLAMWMKLLDTMPAMLNKDPALMKSYVRSKASLDNLYQPSRGIYMVSPVYLHGLFMDNLEVWSLKAHNNQARRAVEADKLAKGIKNTFWDPVNKRFLVSTQLEQRSEKPAFYPDHVAQIFPLMVDFPLVPGDARSYYRNWMRDHRAMWLDQGKKDYPWGLVAVLAVRQNDKTSAGCWLREAAPLRHSSRWAVTDETSYQILLSKGVTPASEKAACA
ncbi:MAG TPA: hypothetical protein VE934_09165 [Polaromonas sp.]|uniref:hypothetical protein n=1 Tax=Polaromonas sp. TaxID=1869339 RepID=UPI002D6D06B8|nr:hypothetical protein [Polaromonas sp.]HYW57119.1 hypothetical protein [Polaromonas sp.]